MASNIAATDRLAAGVRQDDGSAGRRRSLRQSAEIALFLLPALLLFIVFVLIPLVEAVYYSGFKWNGLVVLLWCGCCGVGLCCFVLWGGLVVLFVCVFRLGFLHFCFFGVFSDF